MMTSFQGEEVAALASTINYEVVSSILPRVTRVYLKGEQVVEVKPLVEMDEPDSASESSGDYLRLSVLFAHGWEL